MSALEDAIAELYRLPPSEFVGERNRLAKETKSGDKAAAAAIKALGKPTVSAWVVNQLYWRKRPAFDALIDAGDRMRAIQTGAMAGEGADQLAEALSARKVALDRLVRLAHSLLDESEMSVTQATIKRVASALDAIAAYGSMPPEPGYGRFNVDLEPPGFAALAALAASLPDMPSRERVNEKQQAERAQRREAARKSGEAARKAAEEAARERSEARAQAETEAKLARARADLADAKKSERAAQRDALQARTRAAEATARVEAAREALEAATSALETAKTEAVASEAEAERAIAALKSATTSVERAESRLAELNH